MSGRRSEAAAGCRFTPKGVSRRRFLTTARQRLLGQVSARAGPRCCRHTPGSCRLVSTWSERRASGGWSAPAVRPECQHRNGGVLAYHGHRRQSASHAGHANLWLRQRRGGRDPVVPGCEVNTEVRVNHAHLTNLTPDTDYVYAAVHDGTTPELGTARTAPSGRKPLRFTSFGDQSTPALGRLADGRYVSDNIGSPSPVTSRLRSSVLPRCST